MKLDPEAVAREYCTGPGSVRYLDESPLDEHEIALVRAGMLAAYRDARPVAADWQGRTRYDSSFGGDIAKWIDARIAELERD